MALQELSTGRNSDGPINENVAQVAAVIVMCHLTNRDLLERLLAAVADQVAHSFVIDNTPADMIGEFPIPAKYGGSVSHVPLGENTGVPAAENVGISKAIEGGFTHVLLLDDDSNLDRNMVKTLLAAESALLAEGNPVASVGPLFIDRKTGKRSFAFRPGRFRISRVPIADSADPVESHYLIASGSLTRISVFRSVGFMRSDFFIDWFDIEWGLRARSKGYRSYIIPRAVMQHSIGDSTVRVFGRDINIRSDIRNYYMIRNATYLLRFKSFREWRVINLIKISLYYAFYSLYSRHPLKSIRLLTSAVIDGVRGKLGRVN